VSNKFGSRDLGIDVVSPTKAVMDKTAFDLYDTLNSLKAQMITDKETMMVACPVCEYPTGILLIDHHRPQERRCSWCKNVSIFVQTQWGNWKIKSLVGNEKIDDRHKTKRN